MENKNILINKYINNHTPRSKVLWIGFDGNPFDIYDTLKVPYEISNKPFASEDVSCVKFAEKPFFTSGQRIENLIISLVTSSDIGNIKDLKSIRRGRYIVDATKFGPNLSEKLFNLIIKSQKKRITKSWLPFLQTQIVEKKDKEIKIKYPTKKQNISKKSLTRNSFEQTLKTLKLKKAYSKSEPTTKSIEEIPTELPSGPYPKDYNKPIYWANNTISSGQSSSSGQNYPTNEVQYQINDITERYQNAIQDYIVTGSTKIQINESKGMSGLAAANYDGAMRPESPIESKLPPPPSEDDFSSYLDDRF